MTHSPSRADSPEATVQSNERASSRDGPKSPSTALARQGPPKLLLDGSALAAEEEASPFPPNNAEDEEIDDDAERRRKLDTLRAQLQRSELNRSPSISRHRNADDEHTAGQNGVADTHEQSPATAETSPSALKSSQRSRRRVQWVGLSADDEFRKFRSSSQLFTPSVLR